MQSHPISSIPFYVAVMLERASYYGLRACLVLFFTSEIIDLSRENALSFYGQGSGAVGIAYLFGGLLGLVDQPKIVALGGMGMQLIGTLVLAFSVNPGMALAGFMLVAIGVGLSKPNIYGFLGKLYQRRPVLDAAVTIGYVMVSLGAFLGIILTTQLTENKDFRSAFLLCALLLFVSMIFMFFTKEEEPTQIVKPLKENQHENLFIPLIIIIGTIAGICFWYFYEFVAVEISLFTYDNPELSHLNHMYSGNINTGVIIGVGAVLAMIYSLIRIDINIKLGIGFILAAMACFLVGDLYPGNQNAESLIFGYFVLISVAEVFFSPLILGYVLYKIETKIATLTIGALFFILMFAMKFQPYDIYPPLDVISAIATKTMLVFGLVFIVLFFIKKYVVVSVVNKNDEETLF